MENRKLVIQLLVVFLLFPFSASAYEPTTAHKALTHEIIKFYDNYNHGVFSEEDKQSLEKGSVEEDNTTRPLMHFYDPIHNKGIFDNETSKDWAQDTKAQALIGNTGLPLLSVLTQSYFGASTDYSWQRAIFEYLYGDRQRAMESLGHVLHLIEDASVPDHTRGDAHPPYLNTVFHQSSPYEKWTNQFNVSNIDIASSLIKENAKPYSFESLNRYFDNLAGYSNWNFFSKDTILDPIFESPVVDGKMIEEQDNEMFVVDNDNKNNQYLLVAFDQYRDLNSGELVRSYYINDDHDYIISDYWDILSKQAILHGVGVVELFFNEVEKEKQAKVLYNLNQNSIQRAITKTKSFFSSLTASVSSLFGFNTNSTTTQQNVIQTTSNTTQEIATNTPIILNNPQTSSTTQDILIVTIHPDTTINVPVQATSEISTQNEPPVLPDNNISTSTPPVIEVVQQQATSTDQIINPTPPVFSGGGYASVFISNDPEINQNTNNIVTASTSATTTSETITATTTEPIIITLDDPDFSVGNYKADDRSVDLTWTIPNTNVATSTSVVFDLFYKDSQNDWASLEEGASATSTQFILGEQDSLYEFKLKAKDTLNSIESNWVFASFNTYKTPVIINEIAWMGTDAQSNDEWIELYNKADYPINLSGLKLESSTSLSIELDGTVGANGYYLLERTASTTIDQVENQVYTGAMNNSGAGANLYLKNSTGEDIDFVHAWFAGDLKQKRSMERVSKYGYGDDQYNWKTFFDDSNVFAKDAKGGDVLGTPGRKNSVDGIYTHVPGSIAEDTTWTKDASPYYINSTINVSPGASLSIEPGVTVKLGGSKQNEREFSTLVIKGSLNASGTENDKITFTSIFDDSDGKDSDQNGDSILPAPMDWNSVKFVDSENSTLNHVDFTYGDMRHKAGLYNFTYDGVLYLDNSKINISNCSIDNISGIGIQAQNGSSVKIENCDISNVSHGVVSGIPVYGFGVNIIDASSTAEILTSNFENNDYGIISKSASNDKFILKNNTFSNNSEKDVYIRSGALNVDIEGNENINNDGFISISGTVASSTKAVLGKNKMPYVVEDRIFVDQNGELDIDPGVVLKMPAYNKSYNPLLIKGSLVVNGTPEDRVVFTLQNQTNWGYMEFTDLSEKNIIKNAVFEYGGNVNVLNSNKKSVLYSKSKDLSITESEFNDNNGGIMVSGDAILNIENSSIKNISNESIYAEENAQVAISGSNIYPNPLTDQGYYTIRATTVDSALITAKNNWWGSDTGPYEVTQNPGGQGGLIAGSILFTPWALSEF